jgi:hypothetical protein
MSGKRQTQFFWFSVHAAIKQRKRFLQEKRSILLDEELFKILKKIYCGQLKEQNDKRNTFRSDKWLAYSKADL